MVENRKQTERRSKDKRWENDKDAWKRNRAVRQRK